MAERTQIKERTCKHCHITMRATALLLKLHAATCSLAPLNTVSKQGSDLPLERGQRDE